jgi:hypothetical protein
MTQKLVALPPSLDSRLVRIRSRIRQVLWLQGVSWLVAVVLGGTLIVGLLDWSLHFDDPVVRLIFGLGILGAGVWVAWRYLLAPLLVPFSNIEMALQIERRYPEFQDSLASTVQFLEAGYDPRLGSPVFQRSVIDDTLEHIDAIDVGDVVDAREARRVTTLAVLICLLTLIVAGLNLTNARIALERLVFPFSAGVWPKKTELQLLHYTEAELVPVEYDPHEPQRTARGSNLELYVENVKGRLPDDVTLQYRFEDERILTESFRRTTLRDREGRPREVGAATLTVTKGPLFYRAVGGDDQEMPWHALTVVPPPVIEELQVTLVPPAYTGEGPEQLPKNRGHLQGLVGTQVTVAATANKPLASAALRLKDRPAQAIELSKNRRHFTASFTIEEAGLYAYWFELRDPEGLEHGDAPRYEIRGIPDLAPEIYIDRPAFDMQITADADLPVRVIAKDDLGLKEIRLVYRLADDDSRSAGAPPDAATGAAAQTIVLFDASESDNHERTTQRDVEYLWSLAPLKLAHGTRVVFHAEATDDYDLGPAHIGRSLVRTLTVVSSEVKVQELASRQAGLLDEFEQIFKTQVRAHEQVGQLHTQLRKAGRLRPEDVDLLKRIELDQRRIAARLFNPADGVEPKTERVLTELEQNKLDAPEILQRIERITQSLQNMRETRFPVIERELTRARKGTESEHISKRAGASQVPQTPSKATQAEDKPFDARRPEDSLDAVPSDSPDEPPPAADRAAQTESLAQAKAGQQAVIDELDAILQMLSEWRSQQDLANDLNDIVARQTEIHRDAVELGKQTLSKDYSRLTPQQQADLSKIADRQQQEAEQLDWFRSKLETMADELGEANPRSRQALEELRNRVDQQGLAGRMRDTARRLGANDVGRATQNQQQILEELAAWNDLLHNRGGSDAETLIKELSDAETQLAELHKRQQEILRKSEEADNLTDGRQREQELQRLSKRQQELREQVSQMARQLRRLQADRPGDTADRAADRMQQAEAHLDGNQGDQAQEDQQEALDDLEQARRELAQVRRQAEEQLAHELLERFGDSLQGMIDRQQTIIEETVRLEEERLERGNLSRGQSRRLLQLADEQRDLKQEADQMTETLKRVEVFALALRGASRQMTRAADRLAERKSDAETVAAETAAKQRLTDLVASMHPETESQPEPRPQQQDDAETGSNRPTGDGVPPLAQLKLLQTLQEDINRRTAELDRLHREAGVLTAEQERELEDLAVEQGELGDLARNLTRELLGPLEEEGDENE